MFNGREMVEMQLYNYYVFFCCCIGCGHMFKVQRIYCAGKPTTASVSTWMRPHDYTKNRKSTARTSPHTVQLFIVSGLAERPTTTTRQRRGAITYSTDLGSSWTYEERLKHVSGKRVDEDKCFISTNSFSISYCSDDENLFDIDESHGIWI